MEQQLGFELNEGVVVLAATPGVLRNLLEGLPESWLRGNEGPATWSPFGEVTLKQLLATWVAHDLGHLAQIARVMARRYETAVGPWWEYLGIMRMSL